MNNIYNQKVELLLKIIPIVAGEECFAIHGGTAINLFVKDLPRYSVDIDLTYIPLEDRDTSIKNINNRLLVIAEKIKKSFKGVRIIHTDEQVEQDLIICRALVAIFSDEFLYSELAFCGGTALHKLYLSPQPRYKQFIANMEEKMDDPDFIGDIQGLLRSDVENKFDVHSAMNK